MSDNQQNDNLEEKKTVSLRSKKKGNNNSNTIKQKEKEVSKQISSANDKPQHGQNANTSKKTKKDVKSAKTIVMKKSSGKDATPNKSEKAVKPKANRKSMLVKTVDDKSANPIFKSEVSTNCSAKSKINLITERQSKSLPKTKSTSVTKSTEMAPSIIDVKRETNLSNKTLISKQQKENDESKKGATSSKSSQTGKLIGKVDEVKKEKDAEKKARLDAIAEAKILKKKLKRQQLKEKKRKLMQEEKERLERERKPILPVFKLTVRNLPPDLSEKLFIEQIQKKNPDLKEFITEYYYVQGYYPTNQFEANVLSRCYINCSDETTMMTVGRTIKQMKFKDDVRGRVEEPTKNENQNIEERGIEEEEASEIYNPVIEKSFLQSMPDFASIGVINTGKWDSCNGKLEMNSAFKKFVEAIDSEGKIPIPEDIFNKMKKVKSVWGNTSLKQLKKNKSQTPEPGQTAVKTGGETEKQKKKKKKKEKRKRKAKERKEAEAKAVSFVGNENKEGSSAEKKKRKRVKKQKNNKSGELDQKS